LLSRRSSLFGRMLQGAGLFAGGRESSHTIGGQAVIEGVMMRSPGRVATVVRRPDGGTATLRQPYVSFTRRHKFFSLPVIRGMVVLIESLALGIGALSFSAEEAMKEEGGGSAGEEGAAGKKGSGKDKGSLSSVGIGLTLVLAFVLGLALFFYLPLKLAEWTGVEHGLLFNLIDGGIRVAFFLAYLGAIGLWKDMRRVFEYHGAEHKSIHAFEATKKLDENEAVRFPTLHPRCGTSFLLMVMIVSIIVFVLLGRPESIGERLLRFAFIPVIAGIAFELTRIPLSGKGKFLSKLLIGPGLQLQRLTTREPDLDQIRIAVMALREVLDDSRTWTEKQTVYSD